MKKHTRSRKPSASPGVHAVLILTALATCWCNAQTPGRTASEAYVLLKITAHDADPDAHSNLQAQIYSVTTNLDAIVLAVSNAADKANAAVAVAGDATMRNAQQDVDLAALSNATAVATATANLANTRAQAANVTNAQNTAAITTLATPAQVTGIVDGAISQIPPPYPGGIQPRHLEGGAGDAHDDMLPVRPRLGDDVWSWLPATPEPPAGKTASIMMRDSSGRSKIATTAFGPLDPNPNILTAIVNVEMLTVSARQFTNAVIKKVASDIAAATAATVRSPDVTTILTKTQAEYDALALAGLLDPATLYIITEGQP